jgi:hypothetical protein
VTVAVLECPARACNIPEEDAAPRMPDAFKTGLILTAGGTEDSKSRPAPFPYAQESSSREDSRPVSNGDQVNRIAALCVCGQNKPGLRSTP